MSRPYVGQRVLFMSAKPEDDPAVAIVTKVNGDNVNLRVWPSCGNAHNAMNVPQRTGAFGYAPIDKPLGDDGRA